MTTLQTFLWAASNVISLVFGILFGVGLVVAYVRKQSAVLAEQQIIAARKLLELRREFGLLDEKLGGDKK